MFEYIIIIFAVMAIVVIATIITLCCCGRCFRRKPDQDEDGVTEVVLYPENTNERGAFEPHNPYFNEYNADAEDNVNGNRYYYHFYESEQQRQEEQRRYYHRIRMHTGQVPLVTAAVAGSGPARGEDPYVGTVVCEPTGTAGGGAGAGRTPVGVREPVSYGEAVYYSRPESTVSPPTQTHGKGKH